MHTAEAIFQNILLGASLAAPVGPVSIEMIQRGLLRGFWASFSVRIGGALGNFLCLLVVYYGLPKTIDHPMVQLSIWILGAAFLFFIGLRGIIKASKQRLLTKDPGDIGSNGLLVGLGLSLTSPVGILWWLGMFAAVISTEEASLLVSSTVILGVLLWGAVLALIASFARRFVKERYLKWVSYLGGILLMGYGVYFVIKAFQAI